MKKIGMVGVGCISGIYLKNFKEVFKDVELVAVCDLIRERAEKAQTEYGIPKIYDTMHELFADPEIDIVLNLTRPYQHFEVSKAALSFDGAAHHHIVVSAAPVLGDALHEPFNPLGQKEEGAVLALLDHFPALGPPWVCFLNEKIRREAGINQAAFHPVIPVLPFPHRLVKIRRLDDCTGIDAAFCIAFMNVAVETAFTAFPAAPPWVPHWHSITPVILLKQV